MTLLFGGTAVGCGEPEPATPREPAASPAVALRVISLHPAASRFVLALGAGANLVAVDPESAQLPGLDTLPLTRLASSALLHPHLVLVPVLPPDAAPLVAALRAAGSEVTEVAPRSYDDVFALYRGVGARLAGADRAEAFAARLGRELGALAAESRGQPRLRVEALRSLDPFEPAPAHGFETDLIELAGGTSTTHSHEPGARPASLAELLEDPPDLVLWVAAEVPDAVARERMQLAFGGVVPAAFFRLDREQFWVSEASGAVRRLRALFASAVDSATASGKRRAQSP